MEKQKSKFTVIDAVIILVVLAVLAIGGKLLLPRIIKPADTQTVSCEVLLADKEKALAQSMNVGDKVTMSYTEKDGGVITGIEVTPAKKTVFDSISGTYVTQDVDDKCDIYVTLDVEAEVTDTSIESGSVVLKVGSDTPIRGKGYASSGYMIAIED